MKFALRGFVAFVAAAIVAAPAGATNGMNMEGYGAIATAMGGASMAYDNGNAGMINNPATLGFMQPGTSRLDVSMGGMHPAVSSNGTESAADAFFMPAFGYVRKDGRLSWGAGMMAQGGMGTEYANGNFWGPLTNATGAMSAADTAISRADGIGRRNRSEVGVGRLLFPLAYEVDDRLVVGGSIDYVWAGMDIQWLVGGAHFADMLPTAGTHRFAAAGNTMAAGFESAFGTVMDDISFGYFDFTDGNRFSQQAKGSGWAGNIGLAYKVDSTLTLGAVYHAKTRISDLKTGTAGATVSWGVNITALGAGAYGVAAGQHTVPVKGQMIVRDFQWPETYGLGCAWQASDRLTVAADYKRINWADVMRNFNMRFIAADAAAQTDNVAAGFAGTVLDIGYYQNWRNQDVLSLGAGYRMSDALTLRGGLNVANNPVPDDTANPLFPAIARTHLTLGFGYAPDKAASLDFSATWAPKVTVTNRWSAIAGVDPIAGAASSNQKIGMGLLNWQLLYSQRF